MPIRAVFRLLLVLTATTPLLAQSAADALQARLLNAPLYLRGFWKNDKLSFDSAGKLQGDSETLPFTLSGIEITKVDLGSKKLALEGRRVAVVFDEFTPRRVLLQAGKMKKHDEQIHIEIAAPPDGDYVSALDAIFARDLASLVPSLPGVWQNFATKHLLSDAPPLDPRSERPNHPEALKKIGGGVQPPRLTHQVEPAFDEYARATKISGSCLINLLVGSDGAPSHLGIVRPAGAGLDEEALKAVQQYVFAPAVEDGKPVAVELNIEVNFQIF
jgi:TonB family protein